MNGAPEWLPSLVLLTDHHGNWQAYIEAIYACFKTDFVDDKPMFQGRLLRLKRFPLTDGKESTFWHMISEGKEEENRTPDLRRCERIKWPRPVIEHDADDIIKIWWNERGNEKRICLWMECENYLIVLSDRTDYILLWTAYLVDRPHQQKKLRKEYESYWKITP
jgi:hypothetical protein